MIKDKKDIVETLLRNNPETRDSDSALLSMYWGEEIENLGEPLCTLSSLLYKGALSSAEAVTRCRRKVQEITPELRGDNWKKRHKAEVVVKEEIRSM
jgi:hypothetical protein